MHRCSRWLCCSGFSWIQSDMFTCRAVSCIIMAYLQNRRAPNKPLEWTGPISTLLRHHKLRACHSGAAFEGQIRYIIAQYKIIELHFQHPGAREKPLMSTSSKVIGAFFSLSGLGVKVTSSFESGESVHSIYIPLRFTPRAIDALAISFT